MKTIRIILSVLIIVGLAALATQRWWVLKLVNAILVSEQASIPLSVPPAAPSLPEGRQCYTYTHEATTTEPYTVTEFIDLTAAHGAITGTKRGTQSGPDMTNGYTGTLSGTAEPGTLTALFSYTIEGSHAVEKEVYRIRADHTGIEKLRYPLVQGTGMLVPDTTKPYHTLFYARVGCDASN